MKRFTRPVHLCWILGLPALAALLGVRFIHDSRADDVAPAAAAARPGVVCFGYVDVEEGVTSLHPLLPGRVTKVEVQENQAVEAGAVLLRLDDYQLRRQVQEAEADLAAAQEQLAQALKLPEQQEARLAQQRATITAVQRRLQGARSVLDHKRQLERKQLVGDSEVTAAEALVQELEARERVEKARLAELELTDPAVGVRSARASVRAKQARLDQARRAQEECALRAPRAGTVLRVLAHPGDVLGAQPTQAAVLFCPGGRRVIRAEVEQEFAGRVAVGQRAVVQDDATAGPTWRGRVLRLSDWYAQRRAILPEPAQLNDTRTLECLIALDPGQPPLRIGQRVRVLLRPGG